MTTGATAHTNAPKPISRRMGPGDILRFLRRVAKPAADAGCWLWTGHRDRKGYGQFWWLGRARWAHRVSYRTFVGPIPAGMTVNHKRECRNPSCVNPDHLELLTIADNSREQHAAWADEVEHA